MPESWLKDIETAFEQRFGLQDVRTEYGRARHINR